MLQYGKWSPLHGAEVVLAAAELLRAEPFRFVLIGEGQLSAELQGAIAARELANVEWLGQLPAAELRAHTLAADVCLGVFGGSEKAARVVPNKVFDALACGRPVVTADSDGAREWLRDGETALLTPAGDAAALAAALRRLLDDARARPSRRGRAGALSARVHALRRGRPSCSRRWSAHDRPRGGCGPAAPTRRGSTGTARRRRPRRAAGASSSASCRWRSWWSPPTSSSPT